jgi:uncharacterized HhH-GPD family protein
MPDWLPDGKLPDASTKRGAFLFLVGTILNQNISGERAWQNVARLSERIDLSPQGLSGYSSDDVEPLVHLAPAVHPFATAMSRAIVGAADQVRQDYSGDTRRLWRDAQSAEAVIDRMTTFRQIGKHKAEVAVFLLASVYKELPMRSEGRMETTCPALLTYLTYQRTGG